MQAGGRARFSWAWWERNIFLQRSSPNTSGISPSWSRCSWCTWAWIFDASAHQHGSALCYYYLSYDVDGAIEECQKGVYHEGRHGFLIYIPSVHSPEMAPAGCQAVTVYTIAPNNPVNGSWESDKEKWADTLLGLAERYVPGLRKHARTRIILTPEDFRRRTHLAHHAFGGCPPRVDKSPPPHCTPINGLWFIGAQSESFGGVCGGLLSAQKAVSMLEGTRV